MSVKRCETCGHETVIPDPPTPPDGFQIMPRDYVAKAGDVYCCSQIPWGPVRDFAGKTASDIDVDFTPIAPYYIASPIPKPFSISEHGPGVYETRNRMTARVTAKDSGNWPWCGNITEHPPMTWGDDGTYGISGCNPYDIVRYIGPLPAETPKPDPGKGWRLLGDDERIESGDQFAFAKDVIQNGGPGGYFVSARCYELLTPSLVNRNHQADAGDRLFRRRIETPWTATPERIHLQKWTRGTEVEWRAVGVEQ